MHFKFRFYVFLNDDVFRRAFFRSENGLESGWGLCVGTLQILHNLTKTEGKLCKHSVSMVGSRIRTCMFLNWLSEVRDHNQ